MVTIYDVAKICGVAPSTVSKAINNYSSIPAETRKKILTAMEELNYIPNNSAKFLSSGFSYNIGILSFFGQSITPFTHPLFMEIINSFQNVVNENNYDLVFISRTVGKKQGTFYQNCVSRNVDGVLMLGSMEEKEMLEVINSEIPSVGFDYVDNDMFGVSSNNYELMYKLTKHLISLGHKNIVYITGDDSKITDKRILAFKTALKDNNIQCDSSMIVKSKYLSLDTINLLIEDILNRKDIPTAIMFPDDYSACKGIKILKEKGYNCPDDISITGFDGIELGRLSSPTLTTCNQNTKKIGETLAHLLIKNIKNKEISKEIVEIKGKLIIGESTGKAKKK